MLLLENRDAQFHPLQPWAILSGHQGAEQGKGWFLFAFFFHFLFFHCFHCLPTTNPGFPLPFLLSFHVLKDRLTFKAFLCSVHPCPLSYSNAQFTFQLRRQCNFHSWECKPGSRTSWDGIPAAWESYLISGCLSFHVCKMRVMPIVLNPEGYYGKQRS